MRIYPNLDVDLTYQNSGSAWKGILRGSTENIELAFNGLYNLCATSGDYKFHDHLQCVCTFWTDKRSMRRFFFNQFYMPRFNGRRDPKHGKLIREAMKQAHIKLAILSKTSHEAFTNFSKVVFLDTYGNGCISAERPDNDMKDAILMNAFTEKDTTAHKTVDNG